MAIDDQKTLEAQMLQMQQKQALTSMGVGAPGSPTSYTAPMSRPEPVERFPSLEKVVAAGFETPKFDVTREPFAMGIELKTDVQPIYKDPRKISPNVTLQQVMNFDNDRVVENFEKAMGVRNAQGEELLFTEGMDYAQRLEVANRFGTTKIIDDEGGLFDVPWDNLIYEQTRLPDPDQLLEFDVQTGEVEFVDGKATPVTEFKRIRARDMTEEDMDLYREAAMLTSLNFVDPEIGKPLFADLMNKRLIKAGIEDARTRADIIDYAVSSPGMGDIEKIASMVGENAIKFPFQMALWGVGELIDAADNLSLDFEDTDLGYFDIRQSERRQAIMDTYWEPLSHRMIATMAQRGTKISLADAEEYIYTMTGLAPRVAKVAGEIMIPTRAASALTALRSKKEVARFKEFYAEQVSKGTKRNFNELLEDYKYIRSGAEAGAEPNWLNKIIASSVGSRVTKGLQVEDAAMQVGQRAEVVSAANYLSRLKNQRASYFSGVKKRGGTPDAKDTQELARLDLDINNATLELQAISRISSTPKFIRDAKVTDMYLVVGAGTAGHIFQQRDETYGITGDPMMGELIGLGGGLLLGLAKGSVPAAYAALQKTAAYKKFGGKKAHVKFLAENISTYSPEMQEGIIQRAEYLDEIYDVLVAEGLDPDLLAQGFGAMTNLVTVKALEDLSRSKVSVKQIGSLATKELEQALNAQRTLVAELRGVLQGIEGGVGDTPKGDFFRLVQRSIEVGQESIDQLANDLTVIEKRGVQYYVDLIDGNSQKFGQQLGPDTVRSFDDAMGRLQDQQLINAADLPKMEFDKVANDTRDNVAAVVTKHADTLRSELASEAQAKKAVTEAVGPTVTAAGRRNAADIVNFDEPGSLLAALLESGHAADKVKAQRMYGVLDGGNYVDEAGNALDGAVSVNISDVFDSIFTGLPDLPLPKITGETVRPGDLAILDQTFQTLSDPFFASLAEGTDKTVKQVVADLKKTFESQGKQFRKGVSEQTQVVQFMREAAAELDSTLDIFDMNFNQLRELDKAVRHMRFTARQSGNLERANTLQTLEELVNNKFDQFEIVDAEGNRAAIDSLNVTFTDDVGQTNIMPVRDALNEANREWAKFKSRWYDMDEKAQVPKWMSWGNRSNVDVSVNNPLGIRYSANPREWFNVKQVSNMDPNVQGKSWFDSLQRTLGDEVIDPATGLPQYTFVEGTNMTNAVTATVKTTIADYLISIQGKVAPAELSRQVDNLNQIFVMRGADGKMKPMLDIATVIDDAIGFSRKTVGDQAFDTAMARVQSDIQTQLAKTLEPAKLAKKQKEIAVSILENYTGARIPADQIADRLIGGGELQLSTVKREIKKILNVSDEEVDGILADVYLDALERRAFKTTDKRVMIADGTNIPESIVDLNEMQRMLGANDPETATLVKQLIGEKRYKVWDATSKLLADRQVTRQGGDFDITGVPRSFSMESYISRFYAINRGVISPRYVISEALLQQFRNKRYNTIRSMLSDPELGGMFLEMVRTGKPLTAKREADFYNLFVASYAKTANTIGKPEPVTMEDKYGRAFTLYPDLDKGIPVTGREALVGEGVRIPLFPEIGKRSEDFKQPSIFD
jgi:hypothetical protein